MASLQISAQVSLSTQFCRHTDAWCWPWQNGGVTLDNMTPRPTLAPLYRRTRAVAVFLVLAATLTTTGCSLLPQEPATTDSTQSPSVAGTGTDPATPAQVPTAEQAFAERMQVSLDKLGASTKAPKRDQMLAAMVEAGAVQEKVEVSVDITPTGLPVDAIEAATPVDSACVIGQVRDGKVTVTILPVLASGRCFVGDQY